MQYRLCLVGWPGPGFGSLGPSFASLVCCFSSGAKLNQAIHIVGAWPSFPYRCFQSFGASQALAIHTPSVRNTSLPFVHHGLTALLHDRSPSLSTWHELTSSHPARPGTSSPPPCCSWHYGLMRRGGSASRRELIGMTPRPRCELTAVVWFPTKLWRALYVAEMIIVLNKLRQPCTICCFTFV